MCEEVEAGGGVVFGRVMLWCKHLGGVQVGGVSHGSGVVAVVPVFDNWVQEFSKDLQ